MSTRGGPMAQALGWLSLALGTADIVVPDAVIRIIGAEPTTGTRVLTRSIGVRELGAGAGMFTTEPTPLLWARVAGDAMDLALVANAMRSGSEKRRTVPAFIALAGVAGLDVAAATRRTKEEPMEARSTITVNADAGTVYRAWRDLARLPAFMDHVESVTQSDGHTHWAAKAPGGGTVEWDAEITDDVPGERIAWRSLPGGSVSNRGEVRFVPAPGRRGTEVHVTLSYDQPAGATGAAVAKLLGQHPSQQVRDDLRRFKQIVETGEVARSDGAPYGPRTKGQFLQRPAQPLEEARP